MKGEDVKKEAKASFTTTLMPFCVAVAGKALVCSFLKLISWCSIFTSSRFVTSDWPNSKGIYIPVVEKHFSAFDSYTDIW